MTCLASSGPSASELLLPFNSIHPSSTIYADIAIMHSATSMLPTGGAGVIGVAFFRQDSPPKQRIACATDMGGSLLNQLNQRVHAVRGSLQRQNHAALMFAVVYALRAGIRFSA